MYRVFNITVRVLIKLRNVMRLWVCYTYQSSGVRVLHWDPYNWNSIEVLMWSFRS